MKYQLGVYRVGMIHNATLGRRVLRIRAPRLALLAWTEGRVLRLRIMWLPRMRNVEPKKRAPEQEHYQG